jgi:hypothetical protein
MDSIQENYVPHETQSFSLKIREELEREKNPKLRILITCSSPSAFFTASF